MFPSPSSLMRSASGAGKLWRSLSNQLLVNFQNRVIFILSHKCLGGLLCLKH
jgi:hypothetical protein